MIGEAVRVHRHSKSRRNGWRIKVSGGAIFHHDLETVVAIQIRNVEGYLGGVIAIIF